jgi:hypothetical protein
MEEHLGSGKAEKRVRGAVVVEEGKEVKEPKMCI